MEGSSMALGKTGKNKISKLDTSVNLFESPSLRDLFPASARNSLGTLSSL